MLAGCEHCTIVESSFGVHACYVNNTAKLVQKAWFQHHTEEIVQRFDVDIHDEVIYDFCGLPDQLLAQSMATGASKIGDTIKSDKVLLRTL